MRVLLGELATRDRVLGLNNLLRESWILERPESENTLPQLLSAIDIELTIPHRYKVRVGYIDIHATDLSAICDIAPKLEQPCQRAFIAILKLLLVDLFLLLLFFFLFGSSKQ